MNGLSPDIDLAFLVRRQLEQLCLGQFQFQLVFDDDASVEVEADFSLDGVRGNVQSAHVLHALLGRSILGAYRIAPGDLRIDFGSHVLVLHDSNENYESYVLHGAGTTVVV